MRLPARLQYNLGLLNAERSVDRARSARGTRTGRSAAERQRTGRAKHARWSTSRPSAFRCRPASRPLSARSTSSTRASASRSPFSICRRSNDARAESHNAAAAEYSVQERARPGRAGRRERLSPDAGRVGARRLGAGPDARSAEALYNQAVRPEGERSGRRHRRAARRGPAEHRAAARHGGARTSSRKPSCSSRG